MFPFFIKFGIWGCCILGLQWNVWAQQDTSQYPHTQDSIMMRVQSHPVLLYASAKALPFASAQIPSEALRRLPEPIIESLLNSTPGIWMQSGILNTNRMSIRGVGYREPFATTGIKVYLDEIPLTNGAGEASVEDINPGLLAGIEILRGPSSALWGAGLGGMILLRSEIPDYDMWRGKLQVGSFGRIQSDQRISVRYGARDQWGTMLQYQYLNDDGYRENNGYNRHSMTWLQQWKGNKGWSLQSFLHAIALKAFIPSSLSIEDYKTKPESAAPAWAMVNGNEDYAKWIAGLTVGYASSKNLIYRGAVFGTWFGSDEVRPFNVLDEQNTAYGTRHRLAWRVHRSGHLTTGFEYYREKYDAATFETLAGGNRGLRLTEDQDHRSYLHAFVQSEWRVLKTGNVFAGLSSAWSRLSAGDIDTDVPVSVFPTIGFNYAITPGLSAAASVSRGYTALSLSDMLDSEGSIHADILPESGWNKELSIKINAHDNVSLKITGYTMHITNTIITRRIQDDLFEKYNGGETLHRGLEVATEFSNQKKSWVWTAAFTFQDNIFSAFNDGGVDFRGKKLPGVPAYRLYQHFRLDFVTNLSVSLTHHWVSAVHLDDANTRRGDGYHLMNATIDYSLHNGEDWKWIISAHLHNLWNVHYSPMFQINAPGANPRYYYPGKPRSVYVSVGFEHALKRG